MKQKMTQFCAFVLVALISTLAQAEDVQKWLREDGLPNLKAQSLILGGHVMTVGVPLATLMLDVKRIRNLEKQAEKSARAGDMATARKLEAKAAKGKGTRLTPWRVAGAVGTVAILYETSKFELMLDPRMVEIEQKKERMNRILESEGLPPVTAADVSAR